jgi:hypothetical protein
MAAAQCEIDCIASPVESLAGVVRDRALSSSMRRRYPLLLSPGKQSNFWSADFGCAAVSNGDAPTKNNGL